VLSPLAGTALSTIQIDNSDALGNDIIRFGIRQKQILRLPCCARNDKKNTELDIMHSAKETGFFTRTVRYNEGLSQKTRFLITGA
jgi:hypothetical protein